MKVLLVCAVAALAFVPSAMASSTTCPTGSYDQYLGPSFTCTSGNLLFSNFGYSPSANPAGVLIPASGITVTPQTMTGDEGFQFASGWSVITQSGGVSSFQTSLISFTVSTVNGLATLKDLELFFNGNFTGTGISGVTEQYCPGNTLILCPIGQGKQLVVTNPPQNFNTQVTFPAVSSISVSKDIDVTSGTNGTATISQVANRFSQNPQVPEPVSMLLLASGLAALGLVGKGIRVRR